MPNREGEPKNVPAFKNTPGSAQPERTRRSWYDRPQKDVVTQLRAFVQDRFKLYGGTWSPVEILRAKLFLEAGPKEETEFFAPVLYAFDARAYERYVPGSQEEREAGSALYYHACSTDGGPTIKLSDPRRRPERRARAASSFSVRARPPYFLLAQTAPILATWPRTASVGQINAR